MKNPSFAYHLADDDAIDLDFSDRKLASISNTAHLTFQNGPPQTPFTPSSSSSTSMYYEGTPSKDKGRGRRPSDASLSSTPNAR